MFSINKDAVLNAELLQKMINKFNIDVVPRLKRYKKYYDGAHDILNKTYADASKPCNKTVINYCRAIADNYCGYLATPGYISYSSQNDIEEIMEILRYNDYQTQDADFMLDALVYGVANELMFHDAEGQTRFRLISPLQCFGIYDDSLTGDLLYFVRIYKANEWDDTDLYKVDVYSDYDVKHYEMSGYNGYLTAIGEEPHYFSQCPANIFIMPEEKPIYECIMRIQDSINQIVSAEIDDYEAFCDAYLALYGVDADTDDVAAMKENRILLLPMDAKAEWLAKGINDAQVENILKRLHDRIFSISSCVDFSSESFTGGVSSGVAIRFKLSGMETRGGKVEAPFRKALQRRIEIICGVVSLKYGEEVFRDIKIDFKRNIPEDNTSLIALINGLKGSVSDATLLSQIPFIDDVNKELEAVSAQKQANMALYNFAAPAEEEEVEEAI